MARLPQPGGDDDVWGDILNDFLLVEHNADGSLKNSPSDADASTKGLLRLTGDLGGTADSPTVPGLADKQTLDADLTTIAGLSPSNDDVIQRKSGAWTNRTPAQLKLDLSLTKSDVGLSNVDNTSDANKPISTATQTALDAKQPLDSDLTALAALTTTSFGRGLLESANAAAVRTAISAQVSGTYLPVVGLLSARPSATGSLTMYFATDDAGGTLYQDTADGVWSATAKRGELGSASIATTPSTTSTSFVAIAGLSVTVTPGVRPLYIEAFAPMSFSGSGTGVVAIFEGSTQVTYGEIKAAEQVLPVTMRARREPTAGVAVTYTLRYGQYGGGTLTVAATSTGPAIITVTEM